MNVSTDEALDTVTVSGVEYPLVGLDFETYYAAGYSLRSAQSTMADYIHDERYQTIGVGLRFPWDEYKWMEDSEWRDFLDQGGRHFLSLCGVCCHHAHFDGYILNYHYQTTPGLWFCTLSQGRALHGVEVGNSLAKLAVHYGVGEKGDEVVKAMGKRREDFSRADWLQYGEYCMQDTRLTLGLLKGMPRFLDSELELIDWTVRAYTEPVFVLDEERMEKFHAAEIQRKQDLMAKIQADKSVLLSNDKFALLLQRLGVDPPMKWSVRKEREDFAFAKADPEFKALLDHENPNVVAAVQARLGVKSTGNETRALRMMRLGKDRRPLGMPLRYYGAHTGRWSGTDKMNPQNWERVNEEKGKGTIRKCLLAPPGCSVAVADSGQIEARVTAWLAGQEDLVEAFRQGRDVYSEFASNAYGRHVDGQKRKPSAAEPNGHVPSAEDKTARSVGKTCTLGLGFSMGAIRFATAMLAGPMGADPIVFTPADVATMRVDYPYFLSDPERVAKAQKVLAPEGVDILSHVATCWHLVNVYRKKNRAIVEFWYEVCGELINCMAEGIETEMGPLKTMKNALILPSGLALRYPDLEQDEHGEWTYTGEEHGRPKKHARLYGGVLTENIVQALARIIVSDQLLMAKSLGYKVGLMTHDEIVMVVPEEQADDALTNLLAIMHEAPEWADGLPLAAEGGTGKNYGEAK